MNSPECCVQDGCIARVHCKNLGYCKEDFRDGYLPSVAAACRNAANYAEIMKPVTARNEPVMCSSADPCYMPFTCASQNRCVNGLASEQPSNPKQHYGDAKLPLYLVPFTFIANVAVALFEGWGKYGLVNWRAARVEAMTYVSALDRHMKKWTNGEKCDPATKVPHLANAAACIAILIDAEVNGTLIDNRPLPCKNVDAMIADLEATLAHLKTMHVGHNPHHYTIDDQERMEASCGV